MHMMMAMVMAMVLLMQYQSYDGLVHSGAVNSKLQLSLAKCRCTLSTRV